MHNLEIIRARNEQAYIKWIQEKKNSRNVALKEILEIFPQIRVNFKEILEDEEDAK
jgi:hypothetical protein